MLTTVLVVLYLLMAFFVFAALRKPRLHSDDDLGDLIASAVLGLLWPMYFLLRFLFRASQ